jgi:hypothetical protein
MLQKDERERFDGVWDWAAYLTQVRLRKKTGWTPVFLTTAFAII